MWRPFPLLIVLFMASVSEGRTQDAGMPVGCYQLELGEWNPPLRPGNAVYQTPPSLVQLPQEAVG